MQLQAIATTRAGNFELTYTRAGNLHTRVLANAIANFPIHGKSILPICLPDKDYDYTDYATQYTILGMSLLDSSNLHHLIRWKI